MCRKGEITVFLAMILFSVCSLLCVVVESARTAGARCYLRMAVDSSADSLMAQYHRELWDKDVYKRQSLCSYMLQRPEGDSTVSTNPPGF